MVFVPALVQLSWRVSAWAAGAGLGLAWTRFFGAGPQTFADGEERVIATWSGAIDLRKVHVRYSRTPAGGILEDIAMNTFTFMKLDGSDVPTSAWLDTDYTQLETFINTMWTTLKPLYPAMTKLDQVRWYYDGDAWRGSPTPTNPAFRVTEFDVAGTAASGFQLPPQVAVSVTEKTASRQSWGRIYLPAMTANVSADSAGRLAATPQDTVADAVEGFYENCRAWKFVPVVFAPALPERPRNRLGPGGAPVMIPARISTVYEITHIQVDNTFDVIRSRRYSAPTVRDLRELAALP